MAAKSNGLPWALNSNNLISLTSRVNLSMHISMSYFYGTKVQMSTALLLYRNCYSFSHPYGTPWEPWDRSTSFERCSCRWRSSKSRQAVLKNDKWLSMTCKGDQNRSFRIESQKTLEETMLLMYNLSECHTKKQNKMHLNSVLMFFM